MNINKTSHNDHTQKLLFCGHEENVMRIAANIDAATKTIAMTSRFQIVQTKESFNTVFVFPYIDLFLIVQILEILYE